MGGQPALVFLGFTHCSDICPTTLYNLKLSDESRDRALPRATFYGASAKTIVDITHAVLAEQ
mgnify:CR=1 FL=1